VHRVTWLDVFTASRFTGNGLAVVHDAAGVPDARMHAFARETRLSETSFLEPAQAEGATYRHRIWMVRGEIPFAGHPSLGAAVAHVRASGETSATVVQETVPGLQPIDVEVRGDLAKASMLQEPATFAAELDPEVVLGLVGLEGSAAVLPVQAVSTGVPQILAVLADDAALDRAQAPDDVALDALLEAHDAIVLYLAVLDGERARARSFFPGGEDPATGSAAGPLCAFAHAHTGVARLTIAQGEAIGRPSRIETAVEGDRIRVGGDAVVVLDGHVTLDE
jgi:trans-2,3-dihydro-3-hydroxyanthranilate isomerase